MVYYLSVPFLSVLVAVSLNFVRAFTMSSFDGGLTGVSFKACAFSDRILMVNKSIFYILEGDDCPGAFGLIDSIVEAFVVTAVNMIRKDSPQSQLFT